MLISLLLLLLGWALLAPTGLVAQDPPPASAAAAVEPAEEEAAPPSPLVEAKQALYVLADQLQRKLGEAAQRPERSDEVEELIREGRRLLVEADELQTTGELPPIETTQDRLLALSNRLDQALRPQRPETASADESAAETGPEAAEQEAEPAPPQPTAPVTPTPDPVPAAAPPADLTVAAHAHFAGRYEEALTHLAAADFPTPRATARALLLRAAARYNLYLLEGEEDAAALAAVRADLARCRSLAPGLAPDPQLFSPRFVRLFSAGG